MEKLLTYKRKKNSHSIDSGCEEFPFSGVPEPSIMDSIVNLIYSHWKMVLIIIISLLIVLIVLVLWLTHSSGQPAEGSAEKQPAAVSTVDKMMIEGVYYGEYEDAKSEEPLTAAVTRSSNGKEHYQILAQGQVYDFYFNRTNGTLESSTLGSGTISVDSITKEIIIRFKGWTFKH